MSKKRFKREFLVTLSPTQQALAQAVLEQFGRWEYFQQSAQDIVNNGADTGWAGFTYHCDTVTFAVKNQRHIIRNILDVLDDTPDATVADYMAGWRILNKLQISAHEIDQVLLLGDPTQTVSTPTAPRASNKVARQSVTLPWLRPRNEEEDAYLHDDSAYIQVMNVMAWYALETVASWYEDTEYR